MLWILRGVVRQRYQVRPSGWLLGGRGTVGVIFEGLGAPKTLRSHDNHVKESYRHIA